MTWLEVGFDQPFVSKLCPGPVLTISIEPTIDFNDRSGMASSTRKTAIDLWQNNIPIVDYEKNAKILFCCENPPGTTEISGSQDSIGIIIPGLNKLNYNGDYWPESIESIHDESILQFIEDHLYLIPLSPRISSFNVLENTNINKDDCKSFARSTKRCWKYLLDKNFKMFSLFFDRARYYQFKMFPNMINEEIEATVASILDKNDIKGWKLSGCGGGGYMICVSNKVIPNAIRIKIRRKNNNF